MPSTSAEGRSSRRSDNVFGVVTGPRGSIVAYRYDKAPATGTGAWSGSHSSVAKTRSSSGVRLVAKVYLLSKSRLLLVLSWRSPSTFSIHQRKFSEKWIWVTGSLFPELISQTPSSSKR